MAPLTFALLAILTASLASAGPVALDNSTLISNGEQALDLNCQFQTLQESDSCTRRLAFCVDDAWQTQSCPGSRSCFALPQIRTNGTFIACTSPNNAASIIAATGVQSDSTNNCTSPGNATFPSTQGGVDSGEPDCGGSGTSFPSGQVVTTSPATTTLPVLTLPPTTTTLSPEQAAPLISLLSADSLNSPASAASIAPGNVINIGGNTGSAPP
ncbi:hypothetical protein BJV74DRAFT_884946 [Russula compacta]|nr:hypothetical protein BJV74DRAFT_884946 [Russula compacta]